MRIYSRTLSCKASPFLYMTGNKGTWYYYWSLITHFRPIRFVYNNVNNPGFKFRHISIFVMRKYIITIELQKEIYKFD